MIKIYDLCFVGNISANIGRVFKFKVTQITEITDPSLPGLILDSIPRPYLVFQKCNIKDLQIGDYLTVETEDDNSFKNWKRTLHPPKRLEDDEIFQYVVEDKAKKMERKALTEFRQGQIRLDRILKRVKEAMIELTPSQRSAFALHVYQYLLK